MYSFLSESSFIVAFSVSFRLGGYLGLRVRQTRKSHSSRHGSGDGQRGVDPGPLVVRFEDGVGDDLRIQAVEEAGDGLALLDDGGDEFPDKVVAEDGGGLALARVAGAGGRLEELGR